MDNRINPLSVAPTAPRQTPKNEFGTVLARGVSTGSTAVLGVASAMAPGGGAVSAALTQTAASGTAAAGTAAAVGGSSAALTGSTNAPLSSDPLEAQRELMAMNQQWSMQYLLLQEQMQRESREYTAQSNILKVRHESAKNSINNIR